MLIGTFCSGIIIIIASIILLTLMTKENSGIFFKKNKKVKCCFDCIYYDDSDIPYCIVNNTYAKHKFNSHISKMTNCPFK